MSKIITVANPKGSKIHFNEDEHKYYDDDGNYFHSTTQIIHSLFPEFPKDMMAYVTARKRIMKEEGYTDKKEVPVGKCMARKRVVLEEWEVNRQQSANLGTQIHRFAECKLRQIPFDMELTSNRAEKMAKVVEPFCDKLLTQYEFLEAEKIIFYSKILLAGTVDLIMKNKTTNKLCIFDWKTNKALNKTDSYNKRGKLFLSHLDHCNFVHYALQLSIYRKILYQEGYGNFEDCEMGLFHINTRKVQGHIIPCLDWEVDQIFDYCKNLKSA